LKFGLTAAAGLVVAIVLTGLLIYTVRTSEEIVNATQASEHRMAAFLRLQHRLDQFQTIATTTSEDFSPTYKSDLKEARLGFIGALEDIMAMPIDSDRLHLAAEALYQQGQKVLAVFNDRDAIDKTVEAIWRKFGHQTALNEAGRIYSDYFELKEMIRSQVLMEDGRLEAGVARAGALQATVKPVAFLCLVLAVLGYGTVLALVWTRLSPGLQRLELGAQAVGAGQMDYRINLRGNDELSRLSRAFDFMADQLAQKQRSLREFARRQEAVVAARTKELEAANQALAATDERRREFFAEISHELRTPLTIIRGEAQLALEPEERSRMDATPVLERILSQTQHLGRLVDDLFLIARAEAGGLRLRRQTLELGELAQKLASEFLAVAAEVGARVDVKAGVPVYAIADPDRLRQMLMALMDNAMRHAGPEVAITLSVWTDGDWAGISVVDDGPGFDTEIVSDLFTRFRCGNSESGGCGLGLTLVRALAEAQDGYAELSNQPFQGGATATIRLPRGSRTEEPGEQSNEIGAGSRG